MRFLFLILFSLFLPVPAHADCTNPDRPLGQMVYNTDWGVFQGCTPAGWVRFNRPTTSPPEGCPGIGDICTGTHAGIIYAGEYEGYKLYVTGADAPAGTYAWNNGSSGERSDLDNTPMPNCPTLGSPRSGNRYSDLSNPACIGIRGRRYTHYQAHFTGIGSPYQAASYCYNLGKATDPSGPGNPLAHGYNDWYLPAVDELEFIYDNLGPQPNHGFQSATYWSSSENNGNNAWNHNFTSGYQGYNLKNNNYRVRCVRR